MMKNNRKFSWSWLLLVIIVCILPIFVNGMMKIPCIWSVGNSNVWIAFWGAYLGAIGSFIMAFIAYRTLLKNDEQLEYIKEQNRPYLCVTIRKSLQQKKSNSEEGKLSSQFYHSQTYYLSIVNHGNMIARNVHVDLLCTDSEVAKNSRIAPNIAKIDEIHFDLPAKNERCFVLTEESYPTGLTKEQVNEQSFFFEIFEKSCFDIKIFYNWENEEYLHEETILVRDSIIDSTTVVQMLNYIDNSIKSLGNAINSFKNS